MSAPDDEPSEPPLGGFLELDLPPPVPGSYLAAWRATDRARAFRNARSAFAALVSGSPGATVWLPAFVCRELAAAIPPTQLRFYPVGAALSPDPAVMEADARPGDVVLGIDYFGCPPTPSIVERLQALPDVLLVEDCAQAADPGARPWGDWRLFSPRKVVGVPDGGLLLPTNGDRVVGPRFELTTRDRLDVATAATAALLRFEDEGATHNDVWHRANQDRERAERVSDERMSRLSWALLGALTLADHAARRRRNFAQLADRLNDLTLLERHDGGVTPFCFPIVVAAKDRTSLCNALHRQRIFPAVHWADLPSPATVFPAEHDLSRCILSLPCDHRYGLAEMDRIAEIVRQTLP